MSRHLPRAGLPRHLPLVLALAVVLAALAELIGTFEFSIGPGKVILFPIIWAILLGGLVSLQRVVRLPETAQRTAVSLVEVGIILFIVRLAFLVGEKIDTLADVSLALALQEVGHLFGSVILALPIAVALGMGRSAVGATYSIDREPNMAYAAERFGADSPEYHGALGIYVFGSVFGALYLSVLAGFLASTGWISPLALAMGTGVGSGSMMAASAAAIAHSYPEMEEQILAYAAAANLVSEIAGVYLAIFVALPLTERLYRFWSKTFRRTAVPAPAAPAATAPAGAQAAPAAAPAGEAAAPTATSTAAPARTPSAPALGRVALYLLLISAVMLVANTVNIGALHPGELGGFALMCAVTFAAFAVKRAAPRVPAMVLASLLGILVASPLNPLREQVLALVSDIQFLATATPVLVLVGLSIGKDSAVLKRLSWRVVLVALVSFGATFVCAALVAQSFI
ncbi:DUF3100 domain-containing protein [Marinitenerispora sediminis]|uniref:DUF3100 domain-containing protein n=2 Tax=Marinitenerispora sediminis TaxID=1931232 RepID=A0A368SYP5_9ACTN|nr:DUF3100 domain-containing protein [Marinitenerispora sediminis]RCV47821.1 hypothetical protein DEF23_26090 [Marinitenerispora sediminis]RCV47955.1 hypothetical protein DEF28_24865 [Marinitenerispora sediminis]RCV49656.1 hypothetical protein DEF24_25005 [Marinitenerispora sediminis]